MRADGGESTRREQTLMPPCRPQMLHQLQTSSFLRSPSFPASQLPTNRERGRERERQEETYAVFKLTYITALFSRYPFPRSSPIFSFSPFYLSPGRRHRLNVQERQTDKGRRRPTRGEGRRWRYGPTRHEFSIKFNTRRARECRCAQRIADLDDRE